MKNKTINKLEEFKDEDLINELIRRYEVMFIAGAKKILYADKKDPAYMGVSTAFKGKPSDIAAVNSNGYMHLAYHLKEAADVKEKHDAKNMRNSNDKKMAKKRINI